MAETVASDVLVLGAGQAAGTLVSVLRQSGYAGSITLVGDEPVLPYQRPPLSKAYFKGEATAESLQVKPEAFYAENAVATRLGRRAITLDRTAKAVTLDDGARLSYGTLVIATGSRPRTLPVPGADLSGVLVLRTLADVDRLKALATAGRRLVVIGAGYIGLEAAAVARQTGLP